jgi:hypothetical protein
MLARLAGVQKGLYFRYVEAQLLRELLKSQ